MVKETNGKEKIQRGRERMVKKTDRENKIERKTTRTRRIREKLASRYTRWWTAYSPSTLWKIRPAPAPSPAETGLW